MSETNTDAMPERMPGELEALFRATLDLSYDCGEWQDGDDVIDAVGNLAGYVYLSDKATAAENAFRKALLAHVAAAALDTKRLDWIENQTWEHFERVVLGRDADSLREAIDAAKSAASPQGVR